MFFLSKQELLHRLKTIQKQRTHLSNSQMVNYGWSINRQKKSGIKGNWRWTSWNSFKRRLWETKHLYSYSCRRQSVLDPIPPPPPPKMDEMDLTISHKQGGFLRVIIIVVDICRIRSIHLSSNFQSRYNRTAKRSCRARYPRNQITGLARSKEVAYSYNVNIQ